MGYSQKKSKQRGWDHLYVCYCTLGNSEHNKVSPSKILQICVTPLANFKAKNTPGNPKLIFWTPLEIKLPFKLTTGIWTCYFFWNPCPQPPVPYLDFSGTVRLVGIPRKISREFHGEQCHLVWGCKLWSNPFFNAMILNHCHFFKDSTMKLEVKYLFPTSSSGTIFFYFSVAWRSGNEDILAHSIRMQRIQTPRSSISGFSLSYVGPKSSMPT